MSEKVHDPKFTPEADQLKHVGLSVNKVKSDNDLYQMIVTNNSKTDLLRAQNAVAAYILWQRGHEQEAIAHNLGVALKTVSRWCIAGVAILRTGEYVRTLAAVESNGYMTQGNVDAATKGAGTAEDKLTALEKLAVSTAVQRNYVTDKGAKLSDEAVAQVVNSLPDVVRADGEPYNAKSAIKAVPFVSEDHEIVRKEQKRATTGGSGDGAPQQPEFHLKAALADVRKIVKDNDGATYVPTAHDLKALLSLVEYLMPESGLDEDIKAAIDAVVAW